MILCDAILSNGGISAEWVLVIVTSILGTIITLVVSFGIGLLRSILNNLQETVDNHSTRIAEHDTLHVKYQEQLKAKIELDSTVNKDQNEKLERIFNKLDTLKARNVPTT